MRIPALLSSLLNVVQSQNWLHTAVTVMRLHAFTTQALSSAETVIDDLKVALLPGCSIEVSNSLVDHQASELAMASVADKLGCGADCVAPIPDSC